jgi:hypothetical protein
MSTLRRLVRRAANASADLGPTHFTESFARMRRRDSWSRSLAAVVALSVVGWLVVRFWPEPTRDETATIGSVAVPDTGSQISLGSIDRAEAPEPVVAFLSFASTHRGTPAALVAPDTAAEGIRQLALALDRVAAARHQDRMELQPVVDDIRLRADALQRARSKAEQARLAHEALVSAGGLMEALRGRGYDAQRRSVDQARDAAEQLSATQPLASQAAVLAHCFDRAAVVVRQLARVDL